MLWALWMGCLVPKSQETVSVFPLSSWNTAVQVGHPLVGTVWDVEQQRMVLYADMLKAVSSSPYVLLGEKHDNPDHHRLQAAFIQDMSSSASTIAFEMLNEDVLIPDGLESSTEFAAAVGWKESGWPDFSLYAPIVDVALSKQLVILPAHPKRESVQRVMRGELSPEEKVWIEEDMRLSEQGKMMLKEEIVQAHCGHAPPSLVEMMTKAQTYKDRFMSEKLTSSVSQTFLIAGTGHTRKMLGIPRFLDAQSIQVIHFVEVDEAKIYPQEYAQESDYVVFTPRVDQEDPCVQFQEQLKKMRAAEESKTEPSPEEENTGQE